VRSMTIPVRVRYAECDPMGLVHHSVYPIWFELARTELLRASGVAYAELEKAGTLIVVVKLEVNYKRPARYDDVLDVTATVTKVGGVRIEHTYEVRRGQELLCIGGTTLACLDRDGRLTGVPASLQMDQPAK
jgi:acyl-CoA thioester hydrolase